MDNDGLRNSLILISAFLIAVVGAFQPSPFYDEEHITVVTYESVYTPVNVTLQVTFGGIYYVEQPNSYNGFNTYQGEITDLVTPVWVFLGIAGSMRFMAWGWSSDMLLIPAMDWDVAMLGGYVIHGGDSLSYGFVNICSDGNLWQGGRYLMSLQLVCFQSNLMPHYLVNKTATRISLQAGSELKVTNSTAISWMDGPMRDYLLLGMIPLTVNTWTQTEAALDEL